MIVQAWNSTGFSPRLYTPPAMTITYYVAEVGNGEARVGASGALLIFPEEFSPPGKLRSGLARSWARHNTPADARGGCRGK